MPEVTRTVEIYLTELEIKTAVAVFAENYTPPGTRSPTATDVTLTFTGNPSTTLSATVTVEETDED